MKQLVPLDRTQVPTPQPSAPIDAARSVPFVAPREPTQPQPFALKTDARHAQHEAVTAARLEAQRREVRAGGGEGIPHRSAGGQAGIANAPI
jgi:hypothetical protein